MGADCRAGVDSGAGRRTGHYHDDNARQYVEHADDDDNRAARHVDDTDHDHPHDDERR